MTLWAYIAKLLLIFQLATPTPTVYVENHLNSSWPVASPVWMVDQYTHSRMVYGTCHTGYRCIRLYQNSSIGNRGETIFGNNGVVYILVNGHMPVRYDLRRTLLAHELGHAFYQSHYHYCVTVMYAPLGCNNHLVPYTFTSEEKASLANY